MNEVIPSEYARMVASLAKPGADIIRDLTPDMAHCWHMASCICGEAGELFDAIKKPAIYAKGTIDRKNVVEEFGDLEFYMEGLRQKLGITREETLAANTEKLLTGKNARYKDGTYSNEAAQARADKVPNGETTMPVHHVSIADPATLKTTVAPVGQPHTSGFAQTVPPKSAEGTSPMQQPGALSPAGAESPSAEVPSNTVRSVTNEQRQAVEIAHELVVQKLERYKQACNILWDDPRSPRWRREHQLAFSELSAAQFQLEQAFDNVPPRKD